MNRGQDARRGTRRLGLLGAVALAALAAGLLVAPGAARAETITVATPEDVFDTSDPTCSLREAVTDASIGADLGCDKEDDGQSRVTIEVPFRRSS